jgi:hypothetical protein
MGHNIVLPKSNSFSVRKENFNRFMSTIHRAIVEDVYLDTGKVAVSFEGTCESDIVLMPLFGYSVPRTIDGEGNSVLDYGHSSWGRYIPQVGDCIIVASDEKGEFHSLGYSTPSYTVLQTADKDLVDTGGLGFSEDSGKKITPGDWDFRSANNSYLYLGKKAVFGSGPHSIVASVANGPDNRLTLTSPELVMEFGMSVARFGAVSRVVIPGDSESYIPAPQERVLTTAQEISFLVNWNGGLPTGNPLCSFSMGDVIDDALPVPAIKVSTYQQPLRRYFNAKDRTGLIDAYDEAIDCLGNYSVTANTATNFDWLTPASTWSVTNLVSSVTSSTSFTVTSPTIGLSGTSITLGAIGTDFAVKGTTFKTALDTFNSAALSACSGAAGVTTPAQIAQIGTAFTGLVAAFTTFMSGIGSMLSTTVKLD